MTHSRYDLRGAFPDGSHRAYASPSTGDTSAGEEGVVAGDGPPSPSPADTDADETDDTSDTENANGTDEGDDGEVRDPERKNLSNEAAKYRRRLRDAEAREARLRMQNAFLMAAIGKVDDLDAAWKLADTAGVKVANGRVTGMDEVVAKTLEKYPYLRPADDHDDEMYQPTSALPNSGQPPNRRKGDNTGAAADRRVLERKYPALARTARIPSRPTR